MKEMVKTRLAAEKLKTASSSNPQETERTVNKNPNRLRNIDMQIHCAEAGGLSVSI